MLNESSSVVSGRRQIDLACVLALLMITIVRLGSTHDSFPGWSGDPFSLPNPVLGITPVFSLIMDAAAVAIAGVVIALGGGLSIVQGVCGVVAAAAIVYHAVIRRHGSLDDALLGFNWFASLAAGLALSQACRAREVRSMAVGVLVGVGPLLALKGGIQYFVEHANTFAAFNADKARFIAAQGWTEGSSMALAYERRLRQAEAIGWFGLANVYAGVGAGLFVVCSGLLLCGRHARVSKGAAVMLLVATLSGAVMLALSGAKGGYAAAFLGMMLLGLGWWLQRPGTMIRFPHLPRAGSRLGLALAACVVGGVLALVVLRGMIGTASGELSVLFRWYYLEGAVSIIRDHWLAGTGPSQFREAYMLAKPALSPEDVTSPHSVLFDYVSTLGMGGLGCAVLWFGLLAGSATSMFAERSVITDPATSDEAALSGRVRIRLMGVPLALGVLATAYLEQPIATVDSTLIRLLGIAAGIGIAAAVAAVADACEPRRLSTALAAGSLALAAQAQIEMTGVHPGSVMWIACVLGACASPLGSRPARGKWLFPVAAGACAVAILGFVLPRTIRWELAIRRSYEQASLLAEIQLRAQALSKNPTGAADDSPRQLVADLGLALGEPVGSARGDFEAAFGKLRTRRVRASIEGLEGAAAAWPNHFPTVRALSKVLLSEAAVPGNAEAARMRAQAELLSAQIAYGVPTTSAYSWLATVYEASTDPTARSRVWDALMAAHLLAPHEPSHLQRLAVLLSESGTAPEAAAEWARKALAADAMLRLDPLRQMSEKDRAELTRIANQK